MILHELGEGTRVGMYKQNVLIRILGRY